MRSKSEPLDYLRSVADEYAERFKEAVKDEKTIREVRRTSPDGNVVIEMDLIADRILEDIVRAHRTPVIFTSEDTEIRKIGVGKPKYVLVADPLDGTKNFQRGIPFYGFSLALARPKPKPRLSDVFAGLVMDLCRDEVFSASRVEGELGKQLETRTKVAPDKPLVSLYAYGMKIDSKYFDLFLGIIARGLGSLALELCYVAEGRIDAVVDVRGVARAVDIAGAVPVITEAGGSMTDLKGMELNADLDAVPRISFIATRDRSVLNKILSLIL